MYKYWHAYSWVCWSKVGEWKDHDLCNQKDIDLRLGFYNHQLCDVSDISKRLEILNFHL